jgi:hypothetical protein
LLVRLERDAGWLWRAVDRVGVYDKVHIGQDEATQLLQLAHQFQKLGEPFSWQGRLAVNVVTQCMNYRFVLRGYSHDVVTRTARKRKRCLPDINSV